MFGFVCYFKREKDVAKVCTLLARVVLISATAGTGGFKAIFRPENKKVLRNV
jgi:hypothetical protein